MSEAPRFYRLRVRNAADSADALVITSVRGGSNPYIARPPSGDGQSFEPTDGAVKTGSYTLLVIDVETSANNRLVTSQLADVNARYQLLSRRAYIDQSPDGSSWSTLIPGFVNAIRLVSPLTYEFAIGDSRRTEVSTDIFGSVILRRDPLTTAPTYSRYPWPTTLIGGPVLQNFGPARNYGGWRVKVSQVVAGTGGGTLQSTGYVQLKLQRDGWFDPRKPFRAVEDFTDKATINYTNQVAKAFFFESPLRQSAGIIGHFPHLVYRVENPDGTLVGLFTPVSEPWGTEVKRPDYITRPGESSFWVNWTGTIQPGGGFVSVPSPGDEFKLFLFATDISEDNPLHVQAHPIDLRVNLWLDYGIPYDAAAAAATRTAIGDDLAVQLRIVKAWKFADFEQFLDGLFGTATRIDAAGARVLFPTRIKNSAAPASTITLADLRDYTGTPFELDEETVCNKVTIRQQRFVGYTAENEDDEGTTPPNDTVITVPQRVEVENGDQQTPGDHETSFEVPGMITRAGGLPLSLEDFTVGIAGEFFDRFGRGAPTGEIHCLPTVTAVLGAEINVDLLHMPNPVVGASPVTQRGGSRIYQIARRTETPSGPDLKLIDAGTSVQAATAPTFTLAASGIDPRKFAELTVTNAGALAAAGIKVRIEYGVGGSAPAGGTLVTQLDPAVSSTLTLPAFDAGSKVWVRMRSELPGHRPSAFTAFSSVTLTALDPPTGLAVSAQDALDISKRMLTWTPGTNALDMPVEVYLRLTSESASADRLIAVLPPGSDQYELTSLDVANRTATVVHREAAPAAGASSAATVAVNTTGTAAALSAPTNPQAFTGVHYNRGRPVPDGRYGMSVVAAVVPSGIEVAMAIGAGAYVTQGVVEAVAGGTTVWTANAPNDGQVRHLKARHVKPGYDPSAYTSPVTINNPWTTDKLHPSFMSADGSTVLLDATLGQPTKTIEIPNSAFIAQLDTGVWDNTHLNYLLGAPAADTAFVAPLILPRGVIITGLTLNSQRTDGARADTLTLYRKSGIGGATTISAITRTASGFDIGGSNSDTSFTEDTTGRAYVLSLVLGGNNRFHSAEITYTMPSYDKAI